ncbi:MAG: ABC transporter permease [Clostridiales bacterium]|nr:ABC transporter permease [Clostridiales bacterium]
MEAVNQAGTARLSKRLRRKRAGRRWGNVFAVAVFTFIYIPIAMMVLFSFNDQRTNYYWNGFTLEWYKYLFTQSDLWGYLVVSLIVAVASVILSLAVGVLGAMGLMRFEFRLKKLISNSLYIPIVIPEVVLGISLLMLFEVAHFPLGYWSMILAHTTFCIPFVVIIMRGRMAGMDMSVEEASMDLGANRITTFFKITLPMLVPGILSSAFMSFTLSIDDVIITNFVTGPYATTLPIKILSMVKVGLKPEVNAMTTVMVVVLILGILANNAVQALMKRRALTNKKSYF